MNIFEIISIHRIPKLHYTGATVFGLKLCHIKSTLNTCLFLFAVLTNE